MAGTPAHRYQPIGRSGPTWGRRPGGRRVMPGRRRGTVRSLRPLRTVRSCGSAVLSHQAADPHCAREPASALRGCSPLAEGGARGQRVRSYTRRPRGESPPHGPSVKARMSPRGRPPLPPLPCCDARARAPTGSWSRRAPDVTPRPSLLSPILESRRLSSQNRRLTSSLQVSPAAALPSCAGLTKPSGAPAAARPGAPLAHPR